MLSEEVLWFGIRKVMDVGNSYRRADIKALLCCLAPLGLPTALFTPVFGKHFTEVAVFSKSRREQKQMAAQSFIHPALFTSIFLWKLKLIDVKL